ncbi:translesion DNA synthesis-associated protein ImuA [Roseateles sp. DB2]|uniref:translesion DNA synthesis-associated protein ImuA n=1 Tax=Roseateles sp. DB2 TaxID=3453717 RepID=UPI003EED890B
MPAASPDARAALLDHPLLREGRLWQAGSLGRCQSSTLRSGFAALDAELPGGGWPSQSLCEILQPAGQHAEWRLLAPGLRGLFATAPGEASRAVPPVLLIAPPFVPHGPGLQDLGLDAAQWVWIKTAPDDASGDAPEGRRQTPGGRHQGQHQGRHPSGQQALHQALWVTEQAIKSQSAAAVLAWLDGARPEQIRRLQAAALNSPAPIFLMRPDCAAAQSSAAPLRLRLSQPAAARGLAPGLLEVLLIKRRGPAMVQPLQLHSLPPRLQLSLPARLRQGVAPLRAAGPARARDATEHAWSPALSLAQETSA